MSELPGNWKTSTIHEVADINVRPKKDELDDDTLASFVPMKCVEAESGRFESPEDKKVGDVKKGYTPMRDGDVIFAKVTPCMENGKAAVVRGLTNGIGFGSTEFYSLRPKKNLLPEFLFYFIIQQGFRREAERHMTGAVGLRRVPKNFIAEYPIPLPPLPEQRRIVARIEALFTRLDAGVAALQQAKSQLKRYRQSVLAAAVTGELTKEWRETNPDVEPAGKLLERILEERREQWNGRGKYKEPAQLPSEFELPDLPATWRNAALGEVYHLQRGRFSVRPRNDPRFYDGPYPFVQIGDLPRAGGTIRDYQQTLNEAGLGVSKMFRAGTPLIAIVGATIGNTGTLGFDSCCPDSLVAIQSEIEPLTRYAELYLQAHKLRIRRDSYSSGGQPNINIAYLEIQPLALPPLAEQHQIVAEVEARTTAIDHLEAELDRQITRSNRLRQSTLAAAFSGDLQ